MPPVPYQERPEADLEALVKQLENRLDQQRAAGLCLDLTRGKPSAEQLDLANGLDGALGGDYRTASGIDARNYGGLRGIPEARMLGGELMGVPADNVIAGGNSSLELMYLIVDIALGTGLAGEPWRAAAAAPPKFLCPVPGYDRHHAICEALGIEMLAVPMTGDGPDMDTVERLVAADSSIKGIWCVPRFSNPTGVVYSDATVRRLAALPAGAGAGFVVMWDNAYAVHPIADDAPALANVFEEARAAGTSESFALFASTSKVTFAGAGIGFAGGEERLLERLERRLSVMTVGPDKVNQLRHARFLEGRLAEHMRRHAALIRPKFDAVVETLEAELGGLGIARWTRPMGGYFISFDARPGLAARIVDLARSAGVTLTPAGATFPYGRDPADANIRLAPTFASLPEVEAAMEVFALCVQLASAETELEARRSGSSS